MGKKVLITGAAGFIGKHAAERFLKEGWEVTGLDNLNDFTYSAQIKYDRLSSAGLDVKPLDGGAHFLKSGNFSFYYADITDQPSVGALIMDGGFDLILHFSGMTSVSASSLSPQAFFGANVQGFINVLEGIRQLPPEKRPRLVYTSSAAVYGNQIVRTLIDADRNLLTPDSIYGATKCMMETAAQTYANLYGLQSIGLRFFNIYGPFERPDTLLHEIAKGLEQGTELSLYGEGNACRDYMYIDDCLDAVQACCDKWLPEGASSIVVNIGTGSPYKASDLILKLETISGRKLRQKRVPMPKGEIVMLSAGTTRFNQLFGVEPKVSIDEGLKRFWNWHSRYYGQGK